MARYAAAFALVCACASEQKIGEIDAPMDAGAGEQDAQLQPDAAPCPAQCSDKSPHVVLDCNGNPLSLCANNEACNNGQCVNACELASLRKSGVGCEYYAVGQTNYQLLGTCFVAFVSNTWGTPITVKASRGMTPYPNIGYLADGSGMNITYTPLVGGLVPDGKTAVFFLSDDDAGFGSLHRNCPVGLNVGEFQKGLGNPGTVDMDAFHLESSAPVVVHTFFAYNHLSHAWPNYSAGASLLLPTSAWDTNYIAATTYDRDSTGIEFFQPMPDLPWIAFVAKEDGTDVTIVPTKSYAGANGISGGTANTPVTYKSLRKGELIRLQDGTNISGSVLGSTKPIGIWGGVGPELLEYPTYSSMHQQIPPIKLLGHEYVAVRYRNRYPNGPMSNERPPWRFVGVVDNTQLLYDPPQPSAPPAIGRGDAREWHISQNPDLTAGTEPFIIRSQDTSHPFLFGAHQTGCGAAGYLASEGGCTGGPEYVNVIPPEQFLARYGFFTEPSYPNTELLFVRKPGADTKYHDVTLDCAGTIYGWKTIGSSQYQYARFELVKGGVNQGNCANGRHDASSDSPFGLTVWGWDMGDVVNPPYMQGASYAFVAGQSGQSINTVIVPPTPK